MEVKKGEGASDEAADDKPKEVLDAVEDDII
jgi:hypothetical protein